MLCIANTGLCEAILCRDGEVIQLTSPHAADTNKDEYQRIVQLGGFITKVCAYFLSLKISCIALYVCGTCTTFLYRMEWSMLLVNHLV